MTEPWNFTETQRRQFREAHAAAKVRAAVRTDYRACKRCDARLILVTGFPPLDWAPDPAGTVAARHGVHGWEARKYQPGDVLAPLEKRRRVHECGAGDG